MVSGNSGASHTGQPPSIASSRNPAKLETAADVAETARPSVTQPSRPGRSAISEAHVRGDLVTPGIPARPAPPGEQLQVRSRRASLDDRVLLLRLVAVLLDRRE